MSKARRSSRLVVAAVALAAALAWPARAAQSPKPAPGPTLVLDTVKGSVEIELYPADAPKSVAHVLELVQKKFYQGLRFHRVEASLVQVGDPKSRNMQYREWWGREGSGTPVGVAEVSKRLRHFRGTVGLANTGSPTLSDSQFYIMKVNTGSSLDGKYTIIGHVTKGMDVVDRIEVADILKSMTVKAESAK